MLIDTHAHLNFRAFENDLDKVIERTLAGDVWMINVGSKYETSRKAVEIAERYEKGVYAAVGLHPIYSTFGLVKTKTDPEEGNFLIKEEIFDKEKYRKLARSKKVVAFGEIGLDYYYKPKTKKKLELFKEKQKEVFLNQMELAQDLDLPLILHCRMAHNDLLEVLKERKVRGVIHCFTGSWKQAEKFLEMGFYLGFNGIIYKLSLDEVIKKTPLDKILIETDCPYLTPSSESGRNEPFFVKHIAKRIARIRGLDFQKVAETTTLNAKKLFEI